MTRPDNPSPSRYDRDAVDQAIASSNRSGRKIGKREARLIHAVLAGRTPSKETDQ